jgi:3-hydroxyethyl bacteriochlorophyllide a dehydrogenase
MKSIAVILEQPGSVTLQELALKRPSEDDVVVAVRFSGISTGTERLLFEGRMPEFPGMGYPLVPGYEAVGEVVEAGPAAKVEVDTSVFVPGAHCFENARSLFGASANNLVVNSDRVVPLEPDLAEAGVAFALAATAHHAIAGGTRPDLIVGHGVLGRLIARLAVLDGREPPTVWEVNRERHAGAEGYRVITPDEDERRDYRSIYDASGDETLLDELVSRLAKGGEIVLAGFYAGRISFAFAPAFMREASFRTASEWSADDMHVVSRLVGSGRLSLDGLVSHIKPASTVAHAYATAFTDPDCLKLALDWRDSQ